MTLTLRAGWNSEADFTSAPGDVCAMAEVLEGRHGTLAAEIADFFAIYHGKRGDQGRAGAWSGVAELVRRRERARLDSN
jgi:hypothetical protein